MAPGQAVRLVRALGCALVSMALLVAVQLQAQTGATVIVAWDPNPASDNVTSYRASIDGVVSQTIPPCDAARCMATFTGVAVGSHTASVLAVNAQGAGPSTAVAFRISSPTPTPDPTTTPKLPLRPMGVTVTQGP